MSENYWYRSHPFFKQGIDISGLVRQYSSPVFIYSLGIVKQQYEKLSTSLPDKFRIFYAQKSNPHPEILSFIRGLGAGCDTASLGEMTAALKAGFTPNKIMLTGPGKTEEELRFAVRNRLYSINVESVQELILLNNICREESIEQDILLRINPGFEAGETNRIIGGLGISKFGIDTDQVPLFMEELKGSSNVTLKGIHIFNSSQILDYERILETTQNVIDTAIEISAEYNIRFSRIDLGGGFGIPYSEDEDELNTNELGMSLKVLLEESPYKDFLKDSHLVYEPGRFLTGMCGIYLTKVLYTKRSYERNIAIIDGGIHHMIRPALIGQPHPILNLTAVLEGRDKQDHYIVAGPLCTSLDEFDNNALLNEIRPGDILAVLNAGAYGYTESMPYFLSQKKAQEIIL